MLQGPVAGTDRTQLGSDPEQQETGRAWSWKTAMRMVPVSGEGNPVYTTQKGGVQVLEEHGEREEPLICSPRFLSFPLDGAGRTDSTYHHHPRWMVLDLDLPKARSHMCSAPFIPQKCDLSLWGLVVGHWPKGLSLPKSHRVAPGLSLQACSGAQSRLSPSSFTVHPAQADVSYTLGIQRPHHCRLPIPQPRRLSSLI